jgi:hypothetical protein
MISLEKMSPEVLIYLQSIRKYFDSHIDAQKYFLTDGNEEVFFDYAIEMSQKNFEESGEPELSLYQFEELRKRVSKSSDSSTELIGIFISLGNLGHISLN